MASRRWWAGLATVVFATVAAASARGQQEPGSPVAQTGAPVAIEAAPDVAVIADDHLKDATPDQAAAALDFCTDVPGCAAIWREGVGTIVILGPAVTDEEDAGIVPPGDY